MSELIVLKQLPIIEYSEMEARGLEVAEQIKLLNLDTILATEPNRSTMKKMRADLNKELAVFEDQRKMIHARYNVSYKGFIESYDKNIKVLFVDASKQLKEKISLVESNMLDTKKSDIEAYFNTACEFDFISIDDVGLNIILSASNKKLMDNIDGFLTKISHEFATIGGMENSVRIESLYRTSLDLSLSVSTVNADIKREKALEEQKSKKAEEEKKRELAKAEKEKEKKEREAVERVERKKREAEQLEQQRINAAKNAELNKTKEAEQEVERLAAEKKRAEEELQIAEKEAERIRLQKESDAKKEAAESKVLSMTFKISGTRANLRKIKLFIEELGVDYE